MSNGSDRKSMDDVLASIRRIVRAEKEPDAESVRPQGERAASREEPLALTPDMRMDAGTVEPEAIARPADPGRPSSAAAAAGAMPDRESLRRLVREVLLEQLEGGDAEDAVRGIIRDELMNGEIGGNISQNVLSLIRSEVAKALDER